MPLRRKAKCGLGIVAGLLLVCAGLLCFQSVRIKLLMWALNTSVRKYTSGLPPVDRVVIYRIVELPSAFPATNLFQLRSKGPRYEVLRSAEITSNQAVDFASASRGMRFSLLLSGLCHEPAYGIRFFKGAKLVFETTFCWKCSNFSCPFLYSGEGQMGFDEHSPGAQEIWSRLQRAVTLGQEGTELRDPSAGRPKRTSAPSHLTP
jgi:hypothetical protein